MRSPPSSAAMPQEVVVKIVETALGKIIESDLLILGAGGGNDHFIYSLDLGPFINHFVKPISGLTPARVENGWFKVMSVILEILEQENVRFLRNPDGSYLRTVGFGQPGPWFLNIEGGQTLKRKIARRIRAEGTHVFDHILDMDSWDRIYK